MMQDLPEGWSWMRLADLAADEPNAMIDGPFGSNLKTADYVARGAIRVIRLGNIGLGKFIDKDQSFVNREKFDGLRKHEARPGDLVIAALAEPVGRATIVPDSIGPAMVKADCVRLRVSPTHDTNYVMHALNSPQGLKRSESTGHGIGRLRINLGEMRDLLVPIAPPGEQRRIVAKLDALQSKSRRAKDALDAIPPLLERFRQSVLAAAFRGDLTADWRAKNPDVEPASELLKRIRVERRRRWEEAELAKMQAKGKAPGDDRWKAKYQEPEAVDTEGLPELPVGWCWTTFETIAQIDLGRQRAPQYQTGRYTRPYLRVANIKDDRIDFSDVLEMDFDAEDFDHYKLAPGDILLSEGQSPELVGQSAIYDSRVEGMCFQKTLHRFRAYQSGPAPQFSQLLFRHYLRSGVFRSVASLTTNIAHLTLVRLKPLHFPLPPNEEQLEVVRRAQSAVERVSSLESSVAQLREQQRRLDRSILAKAFRGELVPQDPTDEPASELLARIRAEASPPPDAKPNGRNGKPPATEAKTLRRPKRSLSTS